MMMRTIQRVQLNKFEIFYAGLGLGEPNGGLTSHFSINFEIQRWLMIQKV